MKSSRLRSEWGEAGPADRELAGGEGARLVRAGGCTVRSLGPWTLIPGLWAVLGVGAAASPSALIRKGSTDDDVRIMKPTQEGWRNFLPPRFMQDCPRLA